MHLDPSPTMASSWPCHRGILCTLVLVQEVDDEQNTQAHCIKLLYKVTAAQTQYSTILLSSRNTQISLSLRLAVKSDNSLPIPSICDLENLMQQ